MCISVIDRKMNVRTRTSVRASAWECELLILLADCGIKHIHFRWEKGFLAELRMQNLH